MSQNTARSSHASRAFVANSWTAGPVTESIQSGYECTAIMAADRTVPGVPSSRNLYTPYNSIVDYGNDDSTSTGDQGPPG